MFHTTLKRPKVFGSVRMSTVRVAESGSVNYQGGQEVTPEWIKAMFRVMASIGNQPSYLGVPQSEKIK